MKKFDIDLIGLMIIAMISLGVCLFMQGIEIDLIIEGVEKMVHEKVYCVCEDMCLEEAMTKEQIQTAINNVMVKDGEITTNKIANEAVTTNKIANNAVTTNKIVNEAVTTEKIANGSVESSKLAFEAVYSTGVYIGNGAEKTIELGFNPSAMIIIGDNNYIIVQIIGGHYVSHSYNDTEQKIVGGSGNITRSSTGITIDDFGGFNEQGETYSYIAYR